MPCRFPISVEVAQAILKVEQGETMQQVTRNLGVQRVTIGRQLKTGRNTRKIHFSTEQARML